MPTFFYNRMEYMNKESSCLSPIANTLTMVIDHAISCLVSIPSFGEDWGCGMAFNELETEV